MLKFAGKIGIGLLGICAVSMSHAQPTGMKGLENLLTPISGKFSCQVTSYDQSNPLQKFVFNHNQLFTSDGKWELQLKQNPSTFQKGVFDGTISFRLSEGTAHSSSVGFSFDFSNWSRKNYVMVPAILYNGNRYPVIGNGYNPDYPKEMYYNPRIPLTISNNLRLSVEQNKASLVELQTGNAATPAICFYSDRLKKGFIFLTEQNTYLGNNGLSIVENAAQDTCIFSVQMPAVRKMAPGFGDFHPSGDQAIDWKAGDSVSLRFSVYMFDAKNIPDLLQQFMRVRKLVTGPNHPRNQLPMSAQLKMGTAICSENWREFQLGHYYLPENNNDFQLGWVSGMMNTYPMLALNDEKERNRVSQELDFVTQKLQGRSGYFFGGITADGKIRPEKMHPDFPAIQAMVRKNSDALLWLLKHLLLFKAQGYGSMIHPEWEKAAKKLADAFVNTWNKYREFGQYIVPETGEIAVFNSTAGAIAPAGLSIASEYFHEPQYLKIAEAAALMYYHRDVEQHGWTGGDCGDISQDANSESSFGFLESLMAIYHYTHDAHWLELAKAQAALCATWTLSYDAVFPANSDIGKLDGKMAGAVFASIQNKHAAPGICTASGDYLFKLFRATGDTLFAELLRDIQHAQVEAVNRPGHLTTNHLIGSSMERIQPSDAEGKSGIGNFIHTRNSWTETNGMLMALELPGVYIQTDQKKIYVFDHVTARMVSSDAKGMIIALTNQTGYDAEVSVFAETSAKAKVSMGYTAFVKWPKVKVGSGKEVFLRIGKDGGLN